MCEALGGGDAKNLLPRKLLAPTFIFSALGVRRRVLKIYRELSASRCHDLFLELALWVSATPRRATYYWNLLRQVATDRRHPNLATFAMLEEKVVTGFTKKTLATCAQMLRRAQEAKTRVRSRVLDNVKTFLAERLVENSSLILYGYSSAVCDAVGASNPPGSCNIIVLEDQQYGEGSLREEKKVKKHLRKHRTYPVAFRDAATLLRKGQQNVVDLNGQHLTLPRGRSTVIVLGCEAYAVDGTTLVPAETDDREDTRTLLSIIREHDTASLVVVGESYKLYERISPPDANVVAPVMKSVRTWLSLLWYLLWGDLKYLQRRDVRLHTIRKSRLAMIIDDNDCHATSAQTFTQSLAASRTTWNSMLNPPHVPADLGFITSCDVYALDLNGVLVNDEHHHYAAFAELTRSSAPLTQDEYRRYCSGKTDAEGIAALIAAERLAGDVAALVAEKETLYRAYVVDRVKLFPGAADLVKRLRDLGKTTYLITASSLADTERLLHDGQIDEFFPPGNLFTSVASFDRANVYRRIIEQHGDPSRIVIVDDTPANLIVAQTLRMRTIGVKTTHPDDLRADQLVQNVQQLLELLPAPPRAEAAPTGELTPAPASAPP